MDWLCSPLPLSLVMGLNDPDLVGFPDRDNGRRRPDAPGGYDSGRQLAALAEPIVVLARVRIAPALAPYFLGRHRLMICHFWIQHPVPPVAVSLDLYSGLSLRPLPCPGGVCGGFVPADGA